MMRRAQAILALLALLVLPLAPLVQAGQSSACGCGCAFCMRHTMEPNGSATAPASAMGHSKMSCHSKAGSQVRECGVHSRHIADVLAPIPPIVLPSASSVSLPLPARSGINRSALPSGPQIPYDFFQPPRA